MKFCLDIYIFFISNFMQDYLIIDKTSDRKSEMEKKME